MYSFETTLAKTMPTVPLYVHIEDCLALFNLIRRPKTRLVQQFCRQADFSEERFWQSAFLVVACHDLGKATVPFQDYLRSGKGRESHALISSWFVRQACADFRWFEVKGTPISVEAMVVSAHHSPLRQNLFQRDYAQNETDPQLLDKVIEQLATEVIAPGFHARFGEHKTLDLCHPQTFKEVYDALNRDRAFARVLKQGGGNLRTLFALLKSVLHYCDWYASGQCFDLDYAPVGVRQHVEEHLLNNGVTPDKWHVHQVRASRHEGHGLLQAPTGSGKTEAALLWADHNAQGRKILYLLPTMTTTNRMRQRLQTTLKREVSIVHGTSEYLLAKERDFETTWDYRRSLFAKTFITPCTVATVDQFLFPLFNWGRWELRLANAANAAIIFDEIHCYQPYTVALIVEAAKRFHELGAKLLFMSATFPQVLRDVLSENLPLKEISHEGALNDLCRVAIHTDTIGKELTESVGQIVADYRQCKKVLVVCNTVAVSKNLFQLLEDIPLCDRMLFHSQFILKDRHAKEDRLETLPKGGFVAVTTQVVEVSLDIDFDVLYTEGCPLDALVQRLGRVNRKGERDRAPVYLHQPSGNWHYVYDRDIVSESMKKVTEHAPVITEHLFRQMVDDLYATAGYADKFNEELGKVRDLITQVQGNCSHIYTLSAAEKELQRITTRESDYLTIDAIPIWPGGSFEEKISNLINKIERVSYSVRVPLFRNRNYFDFREDGLVFVHVKGYDETIGVQFRAEDDIESRII